MTALALALVACCAMVCGTRLVLRGYDIREVEAQAAMGAATGLRSVVDGHGENLAAAVDTMRQMAEAHAALRSEVDSLRAAMALRQV